MAAMPERSLPKPKEKAAIEPHVGFVNRYYFPTKKELLNWLDSNEKRAQKKARNSTDPETVRESYSVAQASSQLRAQLNPMAEDKMLANPVNIFARLSEVLTEIRVSAEALVETEE